MEQRLQKILSAAGVCSRRRAEEYMTEGRVTVDGVPAKLGDRADPAKRRIAVDGIPIPVAEEHTYLMLYKPRGVVTTLSDERGRKTVGDLVAGCGKRVWPVGRLDLDSEGLLLLTDDGELTHRLLHPSHEVEKEYLVWALGAGEEALPLLEQPMALDGERMGPAKVRCIRQEGETAFFSVIIHEGKKRQVRRMCAACGLSVTRLKRIREGELWLDRDLAPGQWRELTQEEFMQEKAHSFLQE